MASGLDAFDEKVRAVLRQVYTEKVIDHAMNPRNVGSLPEADGYASVTGPCGDTMQIWLRLEGERIREATFWTDGCGTTIAAGSMVTELATGKTLAEALRIGQEEVLEALGGLPDESKHCALLAANTLKEAIRDYLAVAKDPWKKAYRKNS
ncbi:MAG: iron-sulfur cluster assembly scaffold protein [Clostridia bacterium]|nr:iron-sulfur cluster assembly scaffold protein [Clostridia bacterium]